MNEKNHEALRHSCAHLLAASILELYPGTLHTIGPAIENGFYFDFEFKNSISDEDLGKIEEKMRELLPKWSQVSEREVSVDEAKSIYSNNPYKLELIDEILEKSEKITLDKMGDFEELCRGGHSQNPSTEIGALKLMSIAGAYWRGSEKNTMLTRIYGTCFPSQKELDEHLFLLDEAKKRDHKKLGRELDLFFFHETSPGMAYWLPKGLTLYNTLYSYARKMYKKYGYEEVATPMLNKKELFETSGHWSHYKDDMFTSDMGENEMFGVKPMNCPNAMTIFGSTTRSYNELPLRLADTSLLHRYELSGTLNGLFRIRQFRQDDAHIFITPEMAESEFQGIMNMIEEMYGGFGLSYRLRYGTRPEKFIGDAKDWDFAENILQKVLEKSGKEFIKVEGEGAFYGPKVDILMKDSLGREWQTGTVQLDIQQPKRFDLSYVDQDGKEKMPFVYHRAIFGSFERFLGILIEHYAGKFPVWLSPMQVVIIPISEDQNEIAQRAQDSLNDRGINSKADLRNDTMQAKIREATLQKVPYMCIIGKKEQEASNDAEIFVAVRSRSGENLGVQDLSSFTARILDEIERKL